MLAHSKQQLEHITSSMKVLDVPSLWQDNAYGEKSASNSYLNSDKFDPKGSL